MARTLTDIIHRYREAETGQWVEALRVRRFHVEPGESVALIGPNGSGKSTMLEILAGLRRPSEGILSVDGRDVWATRTALAARRAAPLLLQRTTLLKGSVLSNVTYGLRVRRREMTMIEIEQRAIEALRITNMADLAHRRRDELSDGQRRRVALAAVLALRPQMVIMDEPTSGLDLASREIVERTVSLLQRDHGVAIVVATHDIRQADRLADRTASLIAGRLFDASVENLFRGEMVGQDERRRFRMISGREWELPATAFLVDPWLQVGAATGPCVIAIPADRMLIERVDDERLQSAASTTSDPPSIPLGEANIHGLRLTRTGDCRVGAELDDRRLVITIPTTRRDELQLKLGDRIRISLPEGSLVAIPDR